MRLTGLKKKKNYLFLNNKTIFYYKIFIFTITIGKFMIVIKIAKAIISLIS
jgi:hypothetical protein